MRWIYGPDLRLVLGLGNQPASIASATEGATAELPPQWLARRRSHPSQTHAHMPLQGSVALSAKWGPVAVHVFCIFVILECTSISRFLFFLCIQWHELDYAGKGEGALHILCHTPFDKDLLFFLQVTWHEPCIGTWKASLAYCPINWHALRRGGQSPALLPPR